MASDTAALLQAIYRAYREKRPADVLALLDDDFRLTVHLPEDALPGGDKPRSKAETAELMRSFMEAYDVLACDPGPIIVADDRATVQPRVRYRNKKTGRIIETKLAHAWWVRGGKAAELEERHDVEKVRAFLRGVAEDGG